jgi:thiamine biosynthesis lipoprotein
MHQKENDLTQPHGSAAQQVAPPSLLGHHQFRAMNTDVRLYLLDPENVEYFAPAEQVFHSMEARLSRFRPDSEICRWNSRSEDAAPVSDLMLDVAERSLDMHRMTGGVFDPAVLPDLERAGYDRSFEQVARVGDVPPGESARRVFSISQVRVDRQRRILSAPVGLRIDLGGIGKGYTVDAVAAVIDPARDFVVNAGGDIFASGNGPDGDGWLVAVTKPQNFDVNVSLLRLHDEALATSTTAVRRWQRGGRLLHHLIDPRTRQPAESGVLSVTVVAPTAVQADVFAKTALLLGPADGPRFLEREGTPGFFIMESGCPIWTSGWTGTVPN